MAHRQIEQNELCKLAYWHMASLEASDEKSLDKIDFNTFYNIWNKIKPHVNKEEARVQYKEFQGKTRQKSKSWALAREIGLSNFLFSMQIIASISNHYINIRNKKFWENSSLLNHEMKEWVKHNK